MQQNNESISDRILQIIKNEGISIYKFSGIIGASNSYFSQLIKHGGSVGSDRIEKILNAYPYIDANWLITGKGEMKKNGIFPVSDSLSDKKVNPSYKVPVYDSFEEHIKDKGEGESRKSLLINVPGTEDTEAFIRVIGYSMGAEIKEGSVIGIKKVKTEYFVSRYKYLILTKSNEKLISHISPDPNDKESIICSSDDCNDFTMPKKEIKAVYRITQAINNI